MKKILILMGVLISSLSMISVATAVPQSQSKTFFEKTEETEALEQQLGKVLLTNNPHPTGLIDLLKKLIQFMINFINELIDIIQDLIGLVSLIESLINMIFVLIDAVMQLIETILGLFNPSASLT